MTFVISLIMGGCISVMALCLMWIMVILLDLALDLVVKAIIKHEGTGSEFAQYARDHDLLD